MNQGNGTFEEGGGAIPSGFQYIPQSLAVADMDGDGQLLDILLGTLDNYPNYLLQNQGSGNFRTVEGAFHDVVDDNIEHWTISIAVSDVNADGRVDVIIAVNDDDHSIQVILNKSGAGAYLEVPGAIPGDNYNTEGIVVADLDGDGLPDLIVDNQKEPNEVLLNQRR